MAVIKVISLALLFAYLNAYFVNNPDLGTQLFAVSLLFFVFTYFVCRDLIKPLSITKKQYYERKSIIYFFLLDCFLIFDFFVTSELNKILDISKSAFNTFFDLIKNQSSILIVFLIFLAILYFYYLERKTDIFRQHKVSKAINTALFLLFLYPFIVYIMFFASPKTNTDLWIIAILRVIIFAFFVYASLEALRRNLPKLKKAEGVSLIVINFVLVVLGVFSFTLESTAPISFFIFYSSAFLLFALNRVLVFRSEFEEQLFTINKTRNTKYLEGQGIKLRGKISTEPYQQKIKLGLSVGEFSHEREFKYLAIHAGSKTYLMDDEGADINRIYKNTSGISELEVGDLVEIKGICVGNSIHKNYGKVVPVIMRIKEKSLLHNISYGERYSKNP